MNNKPEPGVNFTTPACQQHLVTRLSVGIKSLLNWLANSVRAAYFCYDAFLGKFDIPSVT